MFHDAGHKDSLGNPLTSAGHLLWWWLSTGTATPKGHAMKTRGKSMIAALVDTGQWETLTHWNHIGSSSRFRKIETISVNTDGLQSTLVINGTVAHPGACIAWIASR